MKNNIKISLNTIFENLQYYSILSIYNGILYLVPPILQLLKLNKLSIISLILISIISIILIIYSIINIKNSIKLEDYTLKKRNIIIILAIFLYNISSILITLLLF